MTKDLRLTIANQGIVPGRAGSIPRRGTLATCRATSKPLRLASDAQSNRDLHGNRQARGELRDSKLNQLSRFF